MVIGPHLIEKFAEFYGTCTFIIMLTRSHHLSILNHMNPVLAISSYFCKICLDTVVFFVQCMHKLCFVKFVRRMKPGEHIWEQWYIFCCSGS